MNIILEARNLIKTFGDFTAVDNVSFALHQGEILGLLGPNGAGKTTTIQMLLGALTPTKGDVFYFGKNLKEHREEILENINFSSTYTNLPWILTVRENLTFVSYLYDIADRRTRIAEVAALFRLEKLLKTQTQDLSAGELTRLNLAKAFLNSPKVLLLDEPTASLDPDIASVVREFLIDQREKAGVSILITSHNMAEVEDLCDRVIFISQGKLIANDTPENLARSLETSHVSLMVKDGLKRTIEYCKEQGLAHQVRGRFVVVDVTERGIPEFLRGLMDREVFYDEISIEKPTLEDYFLAATKTQKE